MKLEAVLLCISGLPMNATANLLRVSTQSVLNWIREFGQENYEKPEPDKVVVIEIDEVWCALPEQQCAQNALRLSLDKQQ